MDYAKITWKLREQMFRFSGELSRGLPKVVGRFIAEMLYGIQARQSVRLTEVSRALDESISTKKTVERLSRQLGNPRLWTSLTDRLLEFAAARVRKVGLPGRKEDLTLVVVKGLGAEPLMLLTNLRLTRARKSIWHVVGAYLTRWRIEETLRYIKQSYQLEDIRVLRYVRLQNMMAILMAVVYFTAVYLGLKLKLRVLAQHLVKAARRVFGIPDFRLYALADGIRHLLFNRARGLATYPRPPVPTAYQRLLFGP